jgi:hypothetical protein
MAKKWAEVVKSEGYQKLPDAEKTAAQEQYFSQIVAPNVPEEDIGIAREQFFNHVSSFAPKQKAPTTFAPPVAEPPKNVGTAADSYGFMGEGIEPDAAFAKPRSVMTGVEQTTATPKTTPVKPEVLKAFESRYDAATPEQRKILEAQPNWMGDIARQRAEQMGKFDEARKRAPGKTLERVDPRVEARTQALIDKGEKPEFARVAAEESAVSGVPVGKEMAYMRSQGILEPTDFDFEMFEKYRNAPTIVRGAVKGYEGFKRGALGIHEAIGDFIGNEDYARAQAIRAKESRGQEESMGENANYFGSMFEGAVNSIAQQLPALIGGAITGSEALVLSSMFASSFGQEYSEGKAKGQDGADAAARAGLFGAFELIGERAGLKYQMDNISRMTRNMKTDEVEEFLTNILKKDLPGEYLTTTGDFIVDKSAIGLNQDATLKDYLHQMADTTVQTLMQGGIMTAGIKTPGAIKQALTGKPLEREANIPSAEQLMRNKGFLQGKPTKKDEAPLGPKRTVGALDKRIEPTLTEITPEQKADLRQKRVEDIATRLVETNGLPAEDALKIAANRVQAEDKAELERQDKLQRGVDKRETLIKPADNRVEELTQDLIGAGVPPAEAAQRAMEMAQKEVEDDAIAEAEAKGAEYVGEPIATAGQPSVGVPSQTTTGLPPGGTTEAIPTGLGVAGTTVGEPTAGEAVQPSPLNGKLSLREPTQKEVSTDRINKVLNLGDGASIGFSSIDGDVIISNKEGVEEGVVRHYDQRKGAIRTAEEFPAYVPEALRQPLIDYNIAAYENSKQNTPETNAKTQAAIQQIVTVANSINKEKPEAMNVAQTIEAQQAETQGQEVPAAEQPKKRGRPALAPELKTASEQKRTQQRTAYKAVEKQLTQAQQLLAEADAPIDEGAIQSEEQLREMLDDKRRKRNAAIRTLYDISKINRGKPGQRAAEALKDPSITERELVDAAQGYELRKKTGVVGMSSMSKTIEAAAADTVADEKLGKVTNGAQAITQIIKTGNEFQKILARRIRSSVGNVKIVVVEANQPTPDIFLKNPRYEREWNRARAVYVEGDFDKKKVIYVRGASFGADQGVNNITMLHELLHAATNRKIMLAKQAIDNGQYGDKDLIGAFNELVEVMNNAGDRFNELADQNKLPPHISNLARFGEIFDDPREFLAYGMTDPAMQEFLKTAYGQPSPVGYFNRFVDSVRNFFGMDVNDANALADLINATDSLLTAREVGKLEPLAPQVLAQTKEDEEDGEEAVRTQKEIDKEVDINIEKIRLSRQAEELAREVSSLQALRDPNKIIPSMQQIWKSATYQERKILVTLPTTEFLTSWAGEQIPELKNINVLMEKMGGLTQQLLNSAAILAQTIHKAYKKDSTLQNKLEEIAYASTLTEIDPSDPNSKERNKKLDAMYIGLGSKGQQLYKLIKEHYENLSDYFSHLLDEQIINSNVSPEARDRLMAMVRTIYETGSKINPYFPLVRRGDYWLAIGSGKHRQFYTFETMGQRDSAAEGFAKERRTSLQELKEDQTFVLGNDIGSLRRASYDSSGLLKGMFDVIDSQDFTSPEAREELKDAVYQLYLNTMPEQSFRRQFINRKNITGFSTDLLRNISTTGVKMSTQLAKLKYSPLMRNSISAARDSIVGREELEPFVDEMQARINQMMNPEASGKLNAIGTFFNRASFIHYLSGVASALMQPVGVFQTGTNVLGARYGYGKATVELTKMLKVWDQYGVMRKNPDGSVSVVPPSIANASGFTADEKRAVREMLGRDVSQSTYASALFGYSSVPTMEFDSAWGKTKRGAAMLTGGLMHTTERLSREMMFMASYRLNRKAGKSHEQAVNAAVIDTNEALGNYGQYNRPIFMQKGIGKVLLQFTMYPLHVTLFLLRNFKRSLPLLNKEGKWEAAKMFYGTLGTTFLLAGASGLPLFSMVMGFLGSFWKDEDKPQELKDMDYETWWRNVWVPENLGHLEIGGVQLGDLVTKVVDRGAVNALTGLDIASRTSLNDLWLRDIKETKTIRESAIALAVEKAGPSANMVLAWADGIEAFMNGQYQKGIEKISPALLRNLEIANRLREEGAMDSKGAEIIAKGGFTTGELIGRAVGFNSDILSNHQKLAFKMQAFDQRVNNQRSKLLNNVGREYIELDNFGTDSARKKYLNRLDEVEKFNRRHPEYAIKPENIESSIEKRLKERGVTENWSGIRIDPEKATPQQKEAIINATKEIERRKRERE